MPPDVPQVAPVAAAQSWARNHAEAAMALQALPRAQRAELRRKAQRTRDAGAPHGLIAVDAKHALPARLLIQLVNALAKDSVP